MELTGDLRKAFEALIQKEQFVNQLPAMTQSAFETYFSVPKTTQIDAPSAYLLLLSQILSTGKPLDELIDLIPPSQKEAVKAISRHFLVDIAEQIYESDTNVEGALCDVQWKMFIEHGRQIWQVCLFSWGRKQPLKLRLSYEQLSLLNFEVTQIVAYLSSLDPTK